jgi:uncharacterized membrane protein
MKKQIFTRFPFFLLFILLGMGTALRAQSLYTITKIGPLPDHSGSFGHAINNASEVAGWSNTVQAYHWSNGILSGLPPLPGGEISRGEGIGESGVVLGSADSDSHPEHAVIWTPTRDGWVPTDLGVGEGDIFSMAEAINGSDVICGYSDDAIYTRAAVWDPMSNDPEPYQINILPALTDHFQSLANDINDAEVVVGMSLNFFEARAVSWVRPTGTWEVTELPGLHPNSDSGADAVNSSGDIVGWSVSPVSSMEHAVLWQADTVVDLGRVEGQRTYANGINDDGDVVGEYWNIGLAGGFVRSAGQSTLYDLQELIPTGSPWTIRSAQDINNDGQITGYGVIDGFYHSFLLTPITLTLTGPTPGIAGQINTWDVNGAKPGDRVYFFFSLAGGETEIPGCGSITLDLANPILFGFSTADELGNASLAFFVHPRAEGYTILFQALDYSDCMVSNVTEQTF